MVDVPEPAFRPHTVQWSDEQVSRFWDFVATRAAEQEYFSAKMAPSIAGLMERRLGDLGRIVDVGCGSGHLLAELRRRGHDASGVDSSPESVIAARARLADADGERVARGSFVALPYDADSIDTLVYVEVVEHVLDDALAALLGEARRVLRPRGRIVLTTPNEEDLRVGLVQCPDCGAEFHRMQHVRTWSVGSITTALARAGFQDVDARAGRFIEQGPRLERLVKSLAFRLRGDKVHLMAVGVKA